MSSRIFSAPGSRLGWILAFAGLLVAHVSVALIGWRDQGFAGHEFRQAQTAISTYFIQREHNYQLAYPTPIGRTVNGEEIHFQIAGDRIAYIPLEELFELAKRNTQRHASSIAEMAAKIETVGPVQGFVLDYVIEAKIDQARGQILIRSREWVVRPVDPLVGEPVAEALRSPSRFRGVLGGAKPDTTITLWCYPDSFAAYRLVREEMHRIGSPTAGRPLPEGAPIGGSTEGSKSVVQ